MSNSPRILVVDDDAGIRELISSYLEKHGYQVDVASDVVRMRHRLAQASYSLIVLDLMMPGEDGLSALRGLQRDGGPPVIMLSAAGTDVDRIVGLEIGAEDYLSKPCNPRELLARIRTVLRRALAPAPSSVLTPAVATSTTVSESTSTGEILLFAGWRLDLVARSLHDPDTNEVALSDSEFRLLRTFSEHPRRVLPRERLLDLTLGAGSEAFDRAIDVQISRLRRKLSTGDSRDALIRTVRNEGYMFVPAVTRG
ncbi:MAG: response regulator [Xylophilus ampelinus]